MITADNVTTKRTNTDSDRSGVHVTTLDSEIDGGTSKGPAGDCLAKLRPELGVVTGVTIGTLQPNSYGAGALPRPMQSTSGTWNA